jgi:hypothetical protein
VLKLIIPLVPRDNASALLIFTEPLLDDVLPPLVMSTSPPDLLDADVLPPDRNSKPPEPELPEPAKTLTAPPRPPTASPV